MTLNIFSCKKFTELDSKKAHQELNMFENLVHKFHFLICLVCRRYSRQTNLIENASRCVVVEDKLSDEAKKRISDKLSHH